MGRRFSATGSAVLHGTRGTVWIAIDPATPSGAREVLAYELESDRDIGRHPVRGELLAVCPIADTDGGEGAVLVDAHGEGTSIAAYDDTTGAFVVVAEIAGASWLGATVEMDARPCRTVDGGRQVLVTVARGGSRRPNDFSLLIRPEDVTNARSAGPCVQDECLSMLRDESGVVSWAAVMQWTSALPDRGAGLELLSYSEGLAAGERGLLLQRCTATTGCAEVRSAPSALLAWRAPSLAWRPMAVSSERLLLLIAHDELSGTVLGVDTATLEVAALGTLAGSRPVEYVRLREGPRPVILAGRAAGATLSSLEERAEQLIERRHALPGRPVGPVAEGTGLGLLLEEGSSFRFYPLSDLAER